MSDTERLPATPMFISPLPVSDELPAEADFATEVEDAAELAGIEPVPDEVIAAAVDEADAFASDPSEEADGSVPVEAAQGEAEAEAEAEAPVEAIADIDPPADEPESFGLSSAVSMPAISFGDADDLPGTPEAPPADAAPPLEVQSAIAVDVADPVLDAVPDVADAAVELQSILDSDEEEPLLDDELEHGIASVFAALHAATDTDEAALDDDDDFADDADTPDGSTFRLLGELDRIWHRAA